MHRVPHERTFSRERPTRKEEWADIVAEMSNAGATASDAEFKQIIAYLAKNFPRKP